MKNMASNGVSPTTPRVGWVRISLPGFLGGGDPSNVLDQAALQYRKDAGGDYVVCTKESYRRTGPDLIRSNLVAGLGTRPRWDLVPASATHRMLTPNDLPQDHQFIDVVNRARMELLLAPPEGLPVVGEGFLEMMRQVTTDSGGTPFDSPVIHLVRSEQALSSRISLASMLAQLAVDDRSIQDLMRINQNGGLAFPAMQGSLNGHYMLDAYLGPLLAAASPGAWALAIPRGMSQLIFSWGQVLMRGVRG